MAAKMGVAKLVIKEVTVNDAEDFTGTDAVYLQAIENGPNGNYSA